MYFALIIANYKVYDFIHLSIIKAYPNPASDQITLEFEGSKKIEDLPQSIVFYSEITNSAVKNLDIQKVYNNKIFDDGKILIDVKELPRGIYYMHINDDKVSSKNSEKIRIRLD